MIFNATVIRVVTVLSEDNCSICLEVLDATCAAILDFTTPHNPLIELPSRF
jgi:hypothetical protein